MSPDQVAQALKARRYSKGRWTGKCPAHEDSSASLSITDMGQGQTRVHCFAGCARADVLKSAGLTWRDLGPGGKMTPEVRKRLYMERSMEFQGRLIQCAMLCGYLHPEDQPYWRQVARQAWKQERILLAKLDPENEPKRRREEDYRRMVRQFGEEKGTEEFIRKYCDWRKVKEEGSVQLSGKATAA